MSEEGEVLQERTRRHKNKDKVKCGEAEIETREGGTEGGREGNFAACVVTQWIFQSITIN